MRLCSSSLSTISRDQLNITAGSSADHVNMLNTPTLAHRTVHHANNGLTGSLTDYRAHYKHKIYESRSTDLGTQRKCQLDLLKTLPYRVKRLNAPGHGLQRPFLHTNSLSTSLTILCLAIILGIHLLLHQHILTSAAALNQTMSQIILNNISYFA